METAETTARPEQPNQTPTEASNSYLARANVQFSLSSICVIVESYLAVKNLLKGQYNEAVLDGTIAGIFAGNAIRSWRHFKQSETNNKR